jgi:DNA (cytosine-5)-methyltransferase 1
MKAVHPGGNRLDIPEEYLPECWKDYPDSYGTDLYGRLWWDKPSVTIRADFVKPEKGRYLHPEADRSITMREGARLQTFPDDFEFGTKYKKYVTSQIGNAVPPKLAYHLGVALHRHLDGLKADASSGPEDASIEKAQRIEWNRLKPPKVTSAKRA